MSLDYFSDLLLPAIEDELKQVVITTNQPGMEELYSMLAYHMGWEGEKGKPETRGKRIRPLMVLLCCAAAGADWKNALPAAAGIELLHNFSLIHDDIQDQSHLRRGRETVWKIWGVAQAINAGDTMFVLAHQSMLGLAKSVSETVALKAMNSFTRACLYLTQGQYLDLSYEKRSDLTLTDYWPMVSGKTAALLSCSTEIGSITAQVHSDVSECYRNFGFNLGLAFQALDDMLGIWGDAVLTGKSANSDLMTGKNSLPVLYGMSLKGPFARRWELGDIRPDEVKGLADQLEAEGARDFTQQTASELTDKALQCLEDAQPSGVTGEALRILSRKLLRREK
ncbi:MAG TPA: polyprenyl synthetase family protein [Anaerolineales bacterium]|nr:polyprenyl synthetase family protein [Anaerolineales bacterium]